MTAVAGVWFSPLFVCVSVCFSARYLKTDAARITKIHIQMFHNAFWKLSYFRVKRSKVNVASYKAVPAWVFALL